MNDTDNHFFTIIIRKSKYNNWSKAQNYTEEFTNVGIPYYNGFWEIDVKHCDVRPCSW